jgi:hypothetical protein
MIDSAELEAWCARVENALIADTADAWVELEAIDVPAIPASADVDVHARLSTRLEELVARVDVRRVEITSELAHIAEERRNLAARSKGITSYYSAESLQ